MRYDAIIIGGGPGGSTAATYLAQAGRKVLLLEKERFPRFHIGESLLPYNLELFKEMGVMQKLEAAGFLRKHGAQFFIGNGSRAVKFAFRQGRFNRITEAIQVERAKFDHVLLRHASDSGADAREEHVVRRFAASERGVAVDAAGPDGVEKRFEAAFLIDASGRGNFTGNQERLRVVHPRLKKLAVFGHFHGVRIDEGESGGDTVIVRLENKWFWLIPLSREKVSVGCVMDQDEYTACREAPAQIFDRIWRTSPPLVDRMKDAQPIGAIQTTSDFSYYNKRFAGLRLLRVGDAAGFMDPIFSAGVYLAMHSGRMAAQTVLQSLTRKDAGAPLFAKYEKRVRAAMRFYWEMVENFYTTPFIELFFSPRERFQLASAVNAALAGDLEGRWPLRWRMRLFFWLVKAQAFFPLAPRISLRSEDKPGARAPSVR